MTNCLGEHNSPIILARIILRTDIMATENGNGKGLDGVDHGKKDQRGEEAGDKENTYDKERTECGTDR